MIQSLMATPHVRMSTVTTVEAPFKYVLGVSQVTLSPELLALLWHRYQGDTGSTQSQEACLPVHHLAAPVLKTVRFVKLATQSTTGAVRNVKLSPAFFQGSVTILLLSNQPNVHQRGVSIANKTTRYVWLAKSYGSSQIHSASSPKRFSNSGQARAPTRSQQQTSVWCYTRVRAQQIRT